MTENESKQVPWISLLDTLNTEADRCKKMALAAEGLPMTMADCYRWKEEAYRHAIHLLSNAPAQGSEGYPAASGCRNKSGGDK